MELADIVIYPVKSLRGISVPRVAVEREGLAFDRRWMLVRADSGRFISQREFPRMCLLRTELSPLNAPAIGTRRASEADRKGALVVHAPPGAAAAAGGLPPLRVPLGSTAAAGGGPLIRASVWEFKGSAVDEGDEAAEWFSRALFEAEDDKPASARPRVRLVRHAPDVEDGRRAADPAFALPGSTVGFADGFPVLAANEGSLADLNARIAQGAAGSPPPPPPLAMARFRPNLVIRGGEATSAPWADDGWARVRVGAGGGGADAGGSGMEFDYVKPCGRCKVTTVAPETGETSPDERPLPALRALRSGAALGWGSARPSFRHHVFFGWNVQPVIRSSGEDEGAAAGTDGGGGGGGGGVRAFDGDEPLGVLERGSPVEVVARREWR